MSVFIRFITVKMMMKMKNRSHGHDIGSPRSRYVVNISMMSRYDDANMYYATPKRHLKFNSCENYTETVLKRSGSYEKAHISLVLLTTSPHHP